MKILVLFIIGILACSTLPPASVSGVISPFGNPRSVSTGILADTSSCPTPGVANGVYETTASACWFRCPCGLYLWHYFSSPVAPPANFVVPHDYTQDFTMTAIYGKYQPGGDSCMIKYATQWNLAQDKVNEACGYYCARAAAPVASTKENTCINTCLKNCPL